MRLPLSPQTIEALVRVISGGPGKSLEPPIGIYRGGSKLESFMRACGVRLGHGSDALVSA